MTAETHPEEGFVQNVLSTQRITKFTIRIKFYSLSYRVPTLLLTKKFQDFSRTPKTFFQDSCHSPAMFKYIDKQQLLTLYIQYDSTTHRISYKELFC